MGSSFLMLWSSDIMVSVAMTPGISCMCSLLLRYPLRSLKAERASAFCPASIICTASLLAIAFFKIAPGAEPGIIRTGVCIYACLIGAMMLLALLQRSSLFALGAVLFVFSDLIIAWNMFVEPVPHSGYMIIIPYFAAQWLLFIRATPYRIAPEMRIMRF